MLTLEAGAGQKRAAVWHIHVVEVSQQQVNDQQEWQVLNRPRLVDPETDPPPQAGGSRTHTRMGQPARMPESHRGLVDQYAYCARHHGPGRRCCRIEQSWQEDQQSQKGGQERGDGNCSKAIHCSARSGKRNIRHVD